MFLGNMLCVCLCECGTALRTRTLHSYITILSLGGNTHTHTLVCFSLPTTVKKRELTISSGRQIKHRCYEGLCSNRRVKKQLEPLTASQAWTPPDHHLFVHFKNDLGPADTLLYSVHSDNKPVSSFETLTQRLRCQWMSSRETTFIFIILTMKVCEDAASLSELWTVLYFIKYKPSYLCFLPNSFRSFSPLFTTAACVSSQPEPSLTTAVL